MDEQGHQASNMLSPRNRWIGSLSEDGGAERSGRGDGDEIIIYHSLGFRTDVGFVMDDGKGKGKGNEEVQTGKGGRGKAPPGEMVAPGWE